jgi:3-oxoacyl-[acyl-carrier protein] reductase
MTTGLKGKVAVVTGAASGIGRSTAIRFAEAGASVVVADRNAEGGKAVTEELIASGASAIACEVDVAQAESVERLIAQAEEHFGRVDAVSLNAGLAHNPVPLVDADEAEFDRVFAVNVKGVWLCARAAIPALRRAGGGSIVVTGSVMGERPRPGFATYAPSKAAANHLARTLAVELGPEGIRVNAVAPVATDTAMLPQFLGTDAPEVSREAFIAGIPLGRLALPEDIAGATVFLCSDDARFITGAVLPVDGGRSV